MTNEASGFHDLNSAEAKEIFRQLEDSVPNLDAPPYAEIERLVDHILNSQVEDWQDSEDRLGPIANRGHICNAAWKVQAFLDALGVTRFARDSAKQHGSAGAPNEPA